MGFLDKLQQTAKETLDKGKERLDEMQADKKADGLLRDLGAWYYAGRTGRDGGTADANIERIVAELQAHEAEHGPLGQAGSTEAAPDAPATAPDAPATAPDAPAGEAAPPASPPPPPPPPATSGPPPPPSS